MTTRTGVIAVDLDSTLADTQHRRHLINTENRDQTDWTAYARACANDTPTDVVALLALLRPMHYIVIVTSRPEGARAETLAWLRAHGVECDALVMKDDELSDLDPTTWKVHTIDALRDIYGQVLLHLEDWWETAEAVRTELGIPVVAVNVYGPKVAMNL